jgi:hypothetical protein
MLSLSRAFIALGIGIARNIRRDLSSLTEVLLYLLHLASLSMNRNTPFHAQAIRIQETYFSDTIESSSLERLVENGEIRIKPAHSNGDSSLDSARRDDELTKSTFTLRRHARITTQDGRNIPVRGDVRRTTIGPDYYMLSMSCDWNPNLKDTFGGSCAVIQMLSQHDLALRQGLS